MGLLEDEVDKPWHLTLCTILISTQLLYYAHVATVEWILSFCVQCSKQVVGQCRLAVLRNCVCRSNSESKRGRAQELPDCALWSSILLTMNMLASRKRSTQFARQLASEREKLFPGVPVTHLTRSSIEHCRDRRHEVHVLIPAHTRVILDVLVYALLSLFILDKSRELLLWEGTSVPQA